MAIRLVIFDCDRTLWEHHDVAETTPPFRRVDQDSLEDARGERVRLFPGGGRSWRLFADGVLREPEG